jgi:predicted 3-demethylubiquinone-9 3-methyltransferase (glyoxalase superfamily)
LTDTLRDYFTRRFNIPAMEMTSSEILRALKYDKDAHEVLERIRQIFDVSDMVKFAKMEPMQDDNEMSIVNAFFIVNKTKIEVIETDEENSETETNNGEI